MAASTIMDVGLDADAMGNGHGVAWALGAQAGERRLGEVLAEGGFSRVRRAAETPFNLVLEARA